MQPVLLPHLGSRGARADKCNTDWTGCGCVAGCEHWTVDEGLGCGDARVGVAHLRVCNAATLDDLLGLGTEEGWPPEAQVCHLSHLHGTNDVRHAVRDGGIDGVLGNEALDAKVIRGLLLSRRCERTALLFHFVRCLPSARDDLPHSPHRLAIGGDDGDGAHVVQDVLRHDCLCADAGLGKRDVLGDIFVEVVAVDEHVEVLVDGVLCVGAGGVGGAGDNVWLAADRDNVGGVASARALAVVGMDSSPLECRDATL
mmetsp:Transcript_27145/g.48384  ORF Transcript_27145/g.48384 Transcript_27145/m.48384 type:complete len:256 (+) Transcript_27145:243-1010(+)